MCNVMRDFVSDLPIVHGLFEPPAEQKLESGQPSDYVGVYCLRSWLAIQIQNPPGFVFGKVERWPRSLNVLLCPLSYEVR